jgi:putative tricarboxylic transport membrane protein
MEERRHIRGDVISGGVLAALGVFIVIEARRWEYMGADGPGPGFFPLWYGIAMVVLSVALIGSSLLGKAEAGGRLDWREVGNALMAWAALVACIALFGVLGFLASFALFTLIVVGAIYRKSWLTALAVAAACAASFYLVFPVMLGVSLPTGLLGF